MKKFSATGIKYDTDGEQVELPTSMVVYAEDEDRVADAISDETGFLVSSIGEIKETDYDLIRDGYAFKETFDAGMDEETCQCDIEGTDVYDADTDEYLGHVDFVTPDAITEHTQDEFSEFLEENYL